MSEAIVINNDYGYAVLDFSKVPPNAPLDFDGLAKIATNLTPQSSAPSSPSAGWVYIDDGTNTDSGNKGLRYYNGSSWEDLTGYSEEGVEDVVNGLLAAGDKLSWTYDDTAGMLTIDTTALDSEEVEDQINSLLTAGNATTLTYDDANDTLTVAVDETAISHDNLANVSLEDHRTDEQIQDLVGTLLAAGDKLSWTYDDAAGTLTVDTTALDAEEVEDQVSSLIAGGDSINISYDDVANTLTISTPAIENVVEDTTPQLGGDLDAQGNSLKNVLASQAQSSAFDWKIFKYGGEIHALGKDNYVSYSDAYSAMQFIADNSVNNDVLHVHDQFEIDSIVDITTRLHMKGNTDRSSGFIFASGFNGPLFRHSEEEDIHCTCYALLEITGNNDNEIVWQSADTAQNPLHYRIIKVRAYNIGQNVIDVRYDGAGPNVYMYLGSEFESDVNSAILIDSPDDAYIFNSSLAAIEKAVSVARLYLIGNRTITGGIDFSGNGSKIIGNKIVQPDSGSPANSMIDMNGSKRNIVTSNLLQWLQGTVGDQSSIFTGNGKENVISNNIIYAGGAGLEHGIDARGINSQVINNILTGTYGTAKVGWNAADIDGSIAKNNGVSGEGAKFCDDTNLLSVSYWPGGPSSNSPSASTTYTVMVSPIYLVMGDSGDNNVSITIKNSAGTTLESGLTPGGGTIQRTLQPDWTINFGAFTGTAPEIKAVMAS